MTYRGSAEEIAALKIGDTLYNFDGNRRAARGGGPIYEKHFEAVEITGETKLSWVMSRHPDKVNKKTLTSRCQFADRGYFTKSAMDADIWFHDHRYKIIRQIETISDVTILREVARIIGYHAESATAS